jgi:AcrR family transcriptional regulator
MRSDSIATIDELLDVAEKLFAKHGVEQIALTRIVAASGQRNRSALHYHFGSRDGVLAALLGRRIQAVNALRNTLLDELPHNNVGLTEAVHAIIAPMCLTTVRETWGDNYISILAQVSFRPNLLGERVDETHLTSIRRCRRLVELALPHIPRPLHRRRYRWLFDSVVLEIARWSRQTPRAERTERAAAALIDELVAFGTAAVAAPLAGNGPNGAGRTPRRRT